MSAMSGRMGIQHTLRIWAASSGLGTVCIPVPSTSQTSARPMDHRPVSPEASSALPRKKMGRRRRRSHGLAPVLNCHTARPATTICNISAQHRTQPSHLCSVMRNMQMTWGYTTYVSRQLDAMARYQSAAILIACLSPGLFGKL